MNRLFIFFAIIFAISCKDVKRSYDIIPHPNSVISHSGEFSVNATGFWCDESLEEESKNYISAFAARMKDVANCSQITYGSGSDGQKGFVFVRNESIPKESYKLKVGSDCVKVEASSLAGFIYAIQSIKQLLPPEVYGQTKVDGSKWVIPCVEIDDAPRFGYRGVMIDVARHFFDVKEMKRIIDVMSIHKLNTLHWHLTDDQGWRIEIKKYPKLTDYGSIRKKTMIKKEWETYDTTPYGGYYTQDEIRDVVQYAAQRAITIIPEIDLPGHMMAALACYPHLGCTKGPYEVSGQWGVRDDVLCPGTEATFGFIEDVLSEVIELFPSQYIHIGGDECPKIRWEKCRACQARIKSLGLKGDDKHSAEYFLQSYVTSRVEKFINDRGRKLIGWDEILEGEVAPNATIMSWRGSEWGIEAAKMGHDAIMTPTSHMYIDYYQSRDIDNEPFGIGGYVPIERVHSYEPFVEELTPEQKSHILGVQANLWTEYIADNDHLEYMLLPRMTALSEVQWCQPENKKWENFIAALPNIISIYDVLGYNYAKTIFEITAEIKNNPQKQAVEVVLSTLNDAPIYYTLNGSDPTTADVRYTSPIEIKGECTLKAMVDRGDMKTRIYKQSFIANKATGCNITLNTQPTERYKYNAPGSLVDGVNGLFSYTSGEWAGWFGSPMDVVIEMKGQSVSSVELGALVQKGEHIFPPASLEIYVSDDNKTFTKIAQKSVDMESEKDSDGLKKYKVDFTEVAAGYLRVVANTVDAMPAWHGAAGKKAFVFVDEIRVN